MALLLENVHSDQFVSELLRASGDRLVDITVFKRLSEFPVHNLADDLAARCSVAGASPTYIRFAFAACGRCSSQRALDLGRVLLSDPNSAIEEEVVNALSEFGSTEAASLISDSWKLQTEGFRAEQLQEKDCYLNALMRMQPELATSQFRSLLDALTDQTRRNYVIFKARGLPAAGAFSLLRTIFESSQLESERVQAIVSVGFLRWKEAGAYLVELLCSDLGSPELRATTRASAARIEAQFLPLDRILSAYLTCSEPELKSVLGFLLARCLESSVAPQEIERLLDGTRVAMSSSSVDEQLVGIATMATLCRFGSATTEELVKFAESQLPNSACYGAAVRGLCTLNCDPEALRFLTTVAVSSETKATLRVDAVKYVARTGTLFEQRQILSGLEMLLSNDATWLSAAGAMMNSGNSQSREVLREAIKGGSVSDSVRDRIQSMLAIADEEPEEKR